MSRVLFAILVCAWSTAAQDVDAVKHKLIGTWKLVSYTRPFVHSDRKKPGGAESEELMKGLASYTGTKGDAIVHHVDVSWNESWTGTDQTRFYKFEGNRLSLATTKSLDPVEGKLSVRTLIWERVK